jgi:outer membrane murein-binding lipoprotein Lpp
MKQPVLIGIFSAWLVSLTVGLAVLGWLYVRGPSLNQTKTELTQTSDSSTQLQSQVQALAAQVSALEIQVASSSSSQTTKSAPVIAPSQTIVPAREYYVPLGSGSTYNRDWTPITGAAVNFQPAKYQPIKKVYFEAAGSIISGEVHVVLADVTHNRIYYEGELVFNTSNATWQRSQPLVLSNAPSQLEVQIQSTNGELAILNDSRLVVETGN